MDYNNTHPSYNLCYRKILTIVYITYLTASWSVTPSSSCHCSALSLPHHKTILDRGIAEDGSNLSGVSAVCSWEDGAGRKAAGAATLTNGIVPAVTGVPNLTDTAEEVGPVEVELLRTQTLDVVHLSFNLESGRLILLALRCVWTITTQNYYMYDSLACWQQAFLLINMSTLVL